MNSKVLEEIQEVVDFLDKKIPFRPEVAIILGSGLGGFASSLKEQFSIPYQEIPHFHSPSVEGHEGKILFGKVDGIKVAALQGRWHYYEGHSMDSVVLPTRALASLGVHTLFLTNAAGGINLKFQAGDLVIIEDHLNLMGDNPLTGKDSPLFGPRFPDMSEPYSHECIQILETAAQKLKIPYKKGVYGGLRGPTYETPAEVKMLRTLGCDMVGMSTVPESIAAKHLGMRVMGISCITNMAAGIEKKTLDHKEVQETANSIIQVLTTWMLEVIPKLTKESPLSFPSTNPLKR
ncbi:MAG: purine-nucleoside phosphorylase [Oligoflexia bacterium]|nr:purine-nucleoside phosphorylase [Oligoflexia bacterium]